MPAISDHNVRFRPLGGGEAFSSAMKSFYPVDIIGKGSLFPVSLGIHLPQNVIKTGADSL